MFAAWQGASTVTRAGQSGVVSAPAFRKRVNRLVEGSGKEGSDVTTRNRSLAQFWATVAVVCTVYLGLQVAYIVRLPLVMDEFQGAHAVFQLTRAVPYRDFSPYKTVLGYYIQLPALLVSDDPWAALLSVKLQAAILTAGTLGLGAWALQKHFRRMAVVLALLLLVCMTTFLERSAELRVDMLTSIAGFASLLLLLDRRAGWAGVACGLSLAISQKGAYYAVAAAAALGVRVLFVDRSKATLADLVRFVVATAAVVLAYVVFWAALSSPRSVLEATFIAPRTVAFQSIYEMRLWGWQLTLKANPLYYALAFAALIGLAERWRALRAPYRESVLLPYGVVLIALSVWHRQPWPYFFVLLIPTLFVLHTALIDWELERHERSGRRPAAVVVAVVLVFGVFLPLRRIPRVLARDNTFQRETIRLADALLGRGETYLAGVNLLFDREQAVPELAWLDLRRSTELSHAGPERLRAITADLDSSHTKLYVHNYRLDALPRALRAQLDSGFSHLWGNVFVYAPSIDGTQDSVNIKFAGRYVVRHSSEMVVVGDRSLQPADTVTLTRGWHRTRADASFRLVLAPPLPYRLNPRFKEPRDFFPNVYDY